MSFGATGFQDGQRTSTLDATTPAWVFNQQLLAPATSGAFSTQGMAHTLISVRPSTQNMTLKWTAALDDLMTEVLGSQAYTLDSMVQGRWVVTVPNLGPFMKIDLGQIALSTPNVDSLWALLTNKPRPLSTMPLLAAWNPVTQAIGPLATFDIPVPFYWAGAVSIWANSGGTQLEVALQYEDTTGAWNTFWQQNPAASTLLAPSSLYVPLAPIRLHLVNLSGTATNSSWAFSMVPDLKGI